MTPTPSTCSFSHWEANVEAAKCQGWRKSPTQDPGTRTELGHRPRFYVLSVGESVGFGSMVARKYRGRSLFGPPATQRRSEATLGATRSLAKEVQSSLSREAERGLPQKHHRGGHGSRALLYSLHDDCLRCPTSKHQVSRSHRFHIVALAPQFSSFLAPRDRYLHCRLPLEIPKPLKVIACPRQPPSGTSATQAEESFC